MRVEPYAEDSIVHVIKRGARGLPIVRDKADRNRFIKLLYYLNDEYKDDFWEKSVENIEYLERPHDWPDQKPLVGILAWTLLPNHFHLVLKSLRNDGVSKFMQRVCGSMSTHYNAKYEERGSLFQGSYRGRTADAHGDAYVRLLAVYVMVKNVFDMYRGGLNSALNDFDAAYEWATKYEYSSLSHFSGKKSTHSKILSPDLYGEIFSTSAEFKNWAKECLSYKLEELDTLEKREYGSPGRPKKQV